MSYFFANTAKAGEFASPCFYTDILMIQLHWEMPGVKNQTQWFKFFFCLQLGNPELLPLP